MALLVSACSLTHPPGATSLSPSSSHPRHAAPISEWRPVSSQLYRNKSPDHKPLISPPPTPKATTYTLFSLSHDFSSHLLTMHVTQIHKQEKEEITRDCHGSSLLGWARDACSTRAVPKGTHHQACSLSLYSENTKVQAPRAGWSYPCSGERNTAGRHGDLCQSHSHLSISFPHSAHMGYTFNWPAAQTHLSQQSRRKKDFIFPLK